MFSCGEMSIDSESSIQRSVDVLQSVLMVVMSVKLVGCIGFVVAAGDRAKPDPKT